MLMLRVSALFDGTAHRSALSANTQLASVSPMSVTSEELLLLKLQIQHATIVRANTSTPIRCGESSPT